MKQHKPRTHDVELAKLGFSISDLELSTGVCARKWWKEIHEGKLAHVRIGRRVLITKDQLEQYFQRNSVESFDHKKKVSEILSR